MYNPISTYRLQFHKGFTLADLKTIIPYLKKLGIRTVYASPIFSAMSGSTHGYDGTDPTRINPEIGTEQELLSVAASLKENDMGWLQDIVPNHQAFDPANPWIADILKKGSHSRYASFFDINWQHPSFNGKVIVPFLGDLFERLLEKGEVRIIWKSGCLWFQVASQEYPVNEETYAAVFKNVREAQKNEIAALRANRLQHEPLSDSAQKELDDINADKGRLKQIHESQYYRLSYWKDADSVINYRRFFTVNGLISLKIERPEVFEEFHQKLFEYVDKGLFNGLRVDHIDGLYDPAEYLRELRRRVGDHIYIVVEKILQQNELLPKWPVQGETGYQFLALVDNLQTNKNGKTFFRKKYAKFTGEYEHPDSLRSNAKREILRKHMSGDLDNLFQLLSELDRGFIDTLSLQEKLQLEAALAEFLIACAVYRYYPDSLSNKELLAEVDAILNEVKTDFPTLTNALSHFRDMLLVRGQGMDEDYNKKALHFLRRCMQFTGPLMAKGVEDTLMYIYHPLLSHNEVGDEVTAFGLWPDEFHERILKRAKEFPFTMNATATHDTKRGEDSRARLNVLSENPARWFDVVREWREMSTEISDQLNIHPNDEYFIYQAIYSAHPFPGQDDKNFVERLQQYLVKALREGKQRSNWTPPDEEYESNVKKFISFLLEGSPAFGISFQRHFIETVDFGILNSLSQLVLKLTCPGVPDIYQGSELWDLSFVDPDNRRAVDYLRREKALDEILAEESTHRKEHLSRLWDSRYNGNIKLYLAHRLLRERNANADLLINGRYIPLKVKGKFSAHILAFAREQNNEWMVVAVPLHSAMMAQGDTAGIRNVDWKNTRVVLPPEAPITTQSIWDDKRSVHNGALYAKNLFRDLPVSVTRLMLNDKNRSAGILLSITSLPSRYGTGDFGPAAFDFANKLYQGKQRFWQLLPLNPVSEGAGFGPYSSYSSMGGNTLLISPELLVEEALLSPADLEEWSVNAAGKAAFAAAASFRESLFPKAFENFLERGSAEVAAEFKSFCEREKHWLDDHALYVALKRAYQEKPWIEWEEDHRNRRPDALSAFAVTHNSEIEREKWLQFTFDRQFKALKQYCSDRSIRLIGDLPFYVSHDSADVWANREIFDLDEEGRMKGVAGVPPDYFNDEGQLWGMPVFKWDVLKNSGYTWWLNRIRRNLELVDLLRLDHFRAFAGFWKVDAKETTAINGSWAPGPGKDLFEALQRDFPAMPFIAEDLGEITPDVYELRDMFRLPGMRVLQFAFGDDVPVSINTPHNFEAHSVAYTGTHDNNTSKGWLRTDAKQGRKNLSAYAGMPVTEKNVAETMIRMAYASVSETVIIPMQDILGLDESARMNTPAGPGDHWIWRMAADDFSWKEIDYLRTWVNLYNRG